MGFEHDARLRALVMVLSRKKLQASFQRVEEEPEDTASGRRRPLWEYFVLFPLIALSFYAAIFLGHQQVVHVREMLLRQQLWQMRNAVTIYFVMHEGMPPNLKALAMAQVADKRGGVFFPLLENVRIDDEGQVIDPLGYPYNYNEATGKVTSTAPCCSNW
jgi:hypothetical protein